jgi:hypothetical protein
MFKMNSKDKSLTDEELKAISDQTTVDIDVLKSWYKGQYIFTVAF